VLESERVSTPHLVIGEGYCREPYTARSLVNISGMSYGALSAPAIQALSKGAALAGCWLDTGEGGLAPHHLAGDAEIIMQIGTARYGIRDAQGEFSKARALELSKQVSAFEIKLSQGAKPGKGGVLPGGKVTEEIARIRGIPQGHDSLSPNRHSDIANIDELLDRVQMIRELTGKPVGVKTAIGGWEFSHALCEAVLRRGLDSAPDFLAIDGGEGGSGAAPQVLADHMGLPIMEALPRVVDDLIAAGLKQRIRVVAAGKLVTPAKAAWALCTGADFINTARGFMFSLGCIQAMRCHSNTCPTGITTHNKRLQRGLVVEEKFQRVANYAQGMNREIEMIAHSCGVKHARELRREHVRLVQTAGQSMAMNMLYPYPAVKT
jgi:glutamate synthase domain-containing protein 2